MDVREMRTGPGLVFDAPIGGAADAPLALMLHSVDPYGRRSLTATRSRRAPSGLARGRGTPRAPDRRG